MKNIKFGQTLRFLYVEESFYKFKKSKYWVSIKRHGFSETPYFGLNI